MLYRTVYASWKSHEKRSQCKSMVPFTPRRSLRRKSPHITQKEAQDPFLCNHCTLAPEPPLRFGQPLCKFCTAIAHSGVNLAFRVYEEKFCFVFLLCAHWECWPSHHLRTYQKKTDRGAFQGQVELRGKGAIAPWTALILALPWC